MNKLLKYGSLAIAAITGPTAFFYSILKLKRFLLSFFGQSFPHLEPDKINDLASLCTGFTASGLIVLLIYIVVECAVNKEWV